MPQQHLRQLAEVLPDLSSLWISTMPRGSKDAYTDKQKRQARHIADGYETKGVQPDEAEERAWSTVNKLSGGGKKSASGRKASARSTKSN